VNDPLLALPQGAKVGTSSMRRRCQLLSLRPDLVIEPLRGNIDSRLKKLRAREFDAMILAFAGIHRAGLFDASCMSILPDEQMLPAPGQGALALQCRRRDERTIDLLKPLNDEETEVCVAAERGLVTALHGDCHSPIAARARIIRNDRLTLQSAIGGRDGQTPVIRAGAEGSAGDVNAVVQQVVAQLEQQGVRAMLASG
jgi:hydroxymethylbilane synthase